MPTVHIHMVSGRTAEKKEALIKAVTEAISETLQIPNERVHILIHELPRENIGHGGVPLSKTSPPPSP